MTTARLQLQPLTAAAFSPFGVVIDVGERTPETINDGHALKYADLLPFDCHHGQGRVALHYYRSRARTLPLELRGLERHPLGSQAFWPLQNRPYAIVVAPPGEEPGVASLRAFIAQGTQAIQYHRGTWHHYQIALEADSEFIVLDRQGPGENCDEMVLPEPVLLVN